MNKKILFLNIYGQYAISCDYRLPNNDFLFNSRFKQHAIKLSFISKKIWTIFLDINYIMKLLVFRPMHDDPSYWFDKITSSSLDFENEFKTTRPNQFVQNQLFIYENDFFLNKFNFSYNWTF